MARARTACQERIEKRHLPRRHGWTGATLRPTASADPLATMDE